MDPGRGYPDLHEHLRTPVVVGALAANRAVYCAGMLAGEGDTSRRVGKARSPMDMHVLPYRIPGHGPESEHEAGDEDDAAARAAAGRYLENGTISEKLRRGGIKPETRFVPHLPDVPDHSADHSADHSGKR